MGDQAVFISVDVDPNEDEDTLGRYAKKIGWDWRFVAPGPEFIRDLTRVTSRLILDVTLTPVIIVDKRGRLFQLGEGIKPAREIIDWVNGFQD